MNAVFDALPWWINPRYPMGRIDYFWMSFAARIIGIWGWLISCACLTAASNGADLPSWMYQAWLIPWMLPLIPLQYRRCKAGGVPYHVIWFQYTIFVFETLVWPTLVFAPITAWVFFNELWICLRTNKMPVVRSNPMSVVPASVYVIDQHKLPS